MRDYGTIFTRFWIHKDLKKLDDFPKLLAAYLLTGPHSNSLGCFRLPLGYISEDLERPFETLSEGFQELSRIGFTRYDSGENWVFLPKYLKWNPPTNPNQAKGLEKLFDQVPQNFKDYRTLIDAILAYGKHIDKAFQKRLESLSEGFRNQDQDQEKYQDQNQEVLNGVPNGTPSSSSAEDDGSFSEAIQSETVENEEEDQGSNGSKARHPPCPHEAVINLYHEILPELPKVMEWSEENRKNLRQRWREKKERQDFEWWKAFFLYVRTCDFLMGRKKAWNATFSWLVRPKNMGKVLAGEYAPGSAPKWSPHTIENARVIREWLEERNMIAEDIPF